MHSRPSFRRGPVLSCPSYGHTWLHVGDVLEPSVLRAEGYLLGGRSWSVAFSDSCLCWVAPHLPRGGGCVALLAGQSWAMLQNWPHSDVSMWGCHQSLVWVLGTRVTTVPSFKPSNLLVLKSCCMNDIDICEGQLTGAGGNQSSFRGGR